MWKRILAFIAIPVAAVLSFGALGGVGITLKTLPAGPDGYRTGYLIGAGLAMLFTFLVLFFLWRWIVRTLRAPRDRSGSALPTGQAGPAE